MPARPPEYWQTFLRNRPHLTDAINLAQAAKLAREDVNLFARTCFNDNKGEPIHQAEIHRDLQQFLTDNRRALIELPRDHGKSLQLCIRMLWELGRNPDLRIKIVCVNEALAQERGRFLRDALTHNPRLRLVFPALRRAQPWLAERFSVIRPGDALSPSVAAISIGAGSTGQRADLLVCDDIVDVKAITSKLDRERTSRYFHENLMNLLEPTGRVWCLFTPWHTDDLNGRLKLNPAFAVFRRAVSDDLTPVWPEHWSRARLAERRREIGEVAFARAYRLQCIADDEVPIQRDWVQFWTEPSQYEMIVLAVDPAVSTKARADASALVVLGRTESNEIHCLEAIAQRLSTPRLVQAIDDADRQWNPQAILFESNAAFAGIRDLLQRHARFGPKLVSIVQTRDKLSRVHAFSVVVKNGSFRLRGINPTWVHGGQQDVFNQITMFPIAAHDDLLDAAAFGTEWLLNRPQPRVFLL